MVPANTFFWNKEKANIVFEGEAMGSSVASCQERASNFYLFSEAKIDDEQEERGNNFENEMEAIKASLVDEVMASDLVCEAKERAIASWNEVVEILSVLEISNVIFLCLDTRSVRLLFRWGETAVYL